MCVCHGRVPWSCAMVMCALVYLTVGYDRFGCIYATAGITVDPRLGGGLQRYSICPGIRVVASARKRHDAASTSPDRDNEGRAKDAKTVS